MLQPAFDIIETQSGEPTQPALVMEVSATAISYAIIDRGENKLVAIRRYHFESVAHQSLTEWLRLVIDGDQLLSRTFDEAIVMYNLPESSLVPEKFSDISIYKPITQLVYGDAQKGLILSEKVHGWKIYNVYRVPREVHSFLQQKFEAGKYWHFYTLLLNSMKNVSTSDQLLFKVIFYPDRFIVLLIRSGGLLLLNSYAYQTPEDVAYYLLLISKHFDVDRETTTLHISGLIDSESALYNELYKYFQNVEPEQMPDAIVAPDVAAQFPPHYFSPLVNVALCV
jgi:hypothetical protein